MFIALRRSTQGFNTVQGNYDALAQLRRVHSWVPQDLEGATPGGFATTRVTTGSGGHGSAVWMLSAIDPATGLYVRDVDGTSIYQRNILYYCIRPDNHARVSGGISCSIDDTTYPQGDPFCPHKMVIRKVIRKEANLTDPETLLTAGEVVPFLTAPNGYDLSGMSGEVGTPGVDPNTIRQVGLGLLSFEVRTGTPPFVELITRAVRLREAGSKVGVGSLPMDTGPFTVEIRRSVLPRN